MLYGIINVRRKKTKRMKALIKKILFILGLLTSTLSYSQVDSVNVEGLEKERKNYIIYGTVEAGLGIFGVLVGVRHITYTNKMSSLDYVGAILYGGSGMVFNGMAIKDYLEARKIKKGIKELENEGID